MKQENLVVELTYRFALEMMSVVKTIREGNEYDLASQLWRAGTSIGANVDEYQRGSASHSGGKSLMYGSGRATASGSEPRRLQVENEYCREGSPGDAVLAPPHKGRKHSLRQNG